MKAPHRNKRGLAAVASMIAIALLWAPAAWAHDDYDDEGYYGDDEYGDDGSAWGGAWYHGSDGCDYGHCEHAVAIPQYDGLRGYGAWRYVPAFGAHLWFPWVDASWRPYYYGHWIRTPFGMTWVSHEPWGDIPHHYGRWVYVEPFGWGWVPGWDWSPAWVTWGVVDGYVGWAPCPPAGYRYPHYHRYHASIRFSTYGYGGTFVYHDSGMDFGFWIFVADRDFCGNPVYLHALPSRYSLSLFKTKRVLPVGPRLEPGYVERVSHQKIRTVPMDRRTARVGDRSLEMYEPRGQKEMVRSGLDVAKKSYVKPVRVERVPGDPRTDGRIEKPRTDGGRVEKPRTGGVEGGEKARVEERREGGAKSGAAPTERVKTRNDAPRDDGKAQKSTGRVEGGRKSGTKSGSEADAKAGAKADAKSKPSKKTERASEAPSKGRGR